jgi:hypothetical protein
MAADPGYGPVFRHAALEYMSSREFPSVELEVGGSIAVESVRLCFRAQQHRDFYYVEMARKDERNRFVALLPMPLVETAEVVYYFVVIDTAFRQFVSAQFQSRVTAAALAGSVPGRTPVLKLRPVRPGSMAELRGFRPDGVVGVPTSSTTTAQSPTPAPSPTPAMRSAPTKERAGGSGGRGLLLGAVGGAVAGVLGAMARKDDPQPLPTPSPSPTPSPTPTPTPTPSPTPQPLPSPSPTPSPFAKFYGTYRVMATLDSKSHCEPVSYSDSIVLAGGKAGAWFELYRANAPGVVCSGAIQKTGQFQCSTSTGDNISGQSNGLTIGGTRTYKACVWGFTGPKVAD